ncbi:MAG: hypothetical protein AMJ46_09105 [Latescibacteria bacterium DG_63]|nr:MAG: hypothetical protein AMJ46_09105 [Latescibacteria bacterium DG_63]
MTERAIELHWGMQNVVVGLPEQLRACMAIPKHSEPLKNVEKAILSALSSSTGTSLQAVSKGATRVLIIVSDRTRVTGVKQYLPPLVRFLTDCGIREEGIEILVANGTHSRSGRERLGEFLSAGIVEKFRVSEHDCTDDASHFHAGRTTRGTEVYLNKKVAEADLLILTGSIGFHYFAGFRGGRKSILPGVAAFSSISANHRLTIQGEKGFHPLCKNASLDGNPVHEDMLESLEMIPTSFLFNTIVNENREILDVFAGDPVKAHLEGCDKFRQEAEVPIDEKADCAVVSCGGYPKDSTLIQSHKAVENVSSALKEGGSMVVLARCEDGIGSDTLLSWFAEKGPAQVRRRLASHYTLHGHTALSMMEKARLFRIYLVSDLSDEVVRSAGFFPVRSAEEAFREMLDGKTADVSTLVFPEGSETLAVEGR